MALLVAFALLEFRLRGAPDGPGRPERPSVEPLVRLPRTIEQQARRIRCALAARGCRHDGSARTYTFRRQTGFAELGAVIVLTPLRAPPRGRRRQPRGRPRHAGDIVELELALGVFVERAVQDWAAAIPRCPLLGLAYVTLHLGATGWRSSGSIEPPARFPLVRNALVALDGALARRLRALPGGAAPLAGHGFVDTVSSHTHVNLSSDLLGSLYNPFAAVPSMHFGYALIVGFAVAAYARRPAVRVLGALYPPFMLFDIVATGTTSSSTRRWAASSCSSPGCSPHGPDGTDSRTRDAEGAHVSRAPPSAWAPCASPTPSHTRS